MADVEFSLTIQMWMARKLLRFDAEVWHTKQNCGNKNFRTSISAEDIVQCSLRCSSCTIGHFYHLKVFASIINENKVSMVYPVIGPVTLGYLKELEICLVQSEACSETLFQH